MPSDAPAEGGVRPLWSCLALVLALTGWRVWMLALAQTDLYTDESQYWFWSTDLDFGYFSKPPLIAWIIRAATEAMGGATVFSVRLPAPLLQGLTALAVMALGARLYWPRIGAWSGAIYATLPAATVGAAVISTDTPLLLFVALALLLLLRLAERPSRLTAALLGLAIGFGFLAKYAMLYFVLGALVAALTIPRLRLPWREAAIAALVALLVASGNLVWNAMQGFITLAHTAHNANWRDDWLNPGAMLAFQGAQLGVFGPVTLVALVAAWGGAAHDWRARLLTAFSLPVLLLVTLQALRSEANANWAVFACVAGTPLAVAWLARRHRRWLRLTLGINLAVALVLPLTLLVPEHITRPSGRSVYARLLGREDLAGEIVAMAREAGAQTIITDNRGLLGDLLWATRHDPGLRVRTTPADGSPRNHYDMAIPLAPAGEGPAILIVDGATPARPAGYQEMQQIRQWTVTQPSLSGRVLTVHWLIPAARSAGSTGLSGRH
jgi:hypothetical protein